MSGPPAHDDPRWRLARSRSDPRGVRTAQWTLTDTGGVTYNQVTTTIDRDAVPETVDRPVVR